MNNRFAHQQKIIDEDPVRTGFWLGTGSSKTRIALDLARGKTLVIAPKTQVDDDNWGRENAKWGCDVDLTTITFDIFKRDHATLPRFDTVIVDEAHGMLGITPNTRWRKKVEISKASQRYEALEAYLERTQPERLYLCTATIMKSPMTVYAALKLLGHERHFYAWRHLYYTKLPMPGREVYVPKKDDQVKDWLAKEVRDAGYVGRLQDFFDVPEQTFKTEHIELTEAQKKRIVQLRTEYPEPIVRIGKQHQVENGVLNSDGFSAVEHFDNGKIDRIVELAAEFPRMVVFAKYTHQIFDIQDALTEAGFTTLTLTGDTKDRGAVIKEANELKQCVFIAQAQISAGWELPEYPVMVFASRTYSFVDYDQALGRIQRANHIKKNLYINLVVKKGIDEAVDKSLENKQDFAERVYAEQV